MRGVQADDLERVFGGSRGADAPMGLGGTGTPKRSWPKQARRKRITLTSRNLLSPLDTGPSRPLPRGPAPGCGSPWAAAHARRPSPAPCGPRPQGRRRGGTAPGAACSLTEGRISARRLTKRRSLRPPRRTECAFPLHHRPGGVGRDRPPACGALWKVAQLGKRARATTRQAGGWLRQGPQASAWGPAPHGKAQSGQRASLMARPASGRRRPKRRRRAPGWDQGAGPQAPPTRRPPPGTRRRGHQASRPRARGPRRPGRGRRGRW